MAFYLESEYLDLKKVYSNFSYDQIIPQEQKLQLEKAQQMQKQSEENQEIISQNTYLFVQEKDTLQVDILNLCYYCRLKLQTENQEIQNKIQNEKIFKNFPFQQIKDRICFIIQKYQEQPVLLDSVLEFLIQPIMSEIRIYLKQLMKDNKEIKEIPLEFHDISGIVYLLCKVRHYKYINKFFPHEVNDLEPVAYYLTSQRNHQTEIWETKYVLLLWMSIIILVPFDLITIDSSLICIPDYIDSKDLNQTESSGDQGIINGLINLAKFYLNSSTKMRDAASQFLSNFFGRPDIQKTGKLIEYVKWCSKQIESYALDPLKINFVGAVYHSLVEVFKIGQRVELLEQIPTLIALIQISKSNENTTIRHLKCKLAQRIGMVYLRPRAVTWMYKRGKKNLMDNMQKAGESKLKTNVVVKNETNLNSEAQIKEKKQQEEMMKLDEIDYFEDVDEEQLENIIDFLLINLKDKDTVVRWSAAKGLGRITSRLNMEMADDVVQAVIEMFSPNETESTWHGGCLTIAELSRRGLLLPHRLQDVFPIIHKALHFDINQGSHHIGSNVRDSACYISWAFARAYDPEVLQPYVKQLSANLLITCLYDREINCRRAASASFQEHVGRQGTFTHGIEILTEADYFTLGLKNNAYLNVGLYVSGYQEYYTSFVEHLAFVKLKHQDIDLRKLTSSALALMTPLNPTLIAQEILPGLVDLCYNDNVNVRHGAVYGISEILLGLCGKSEQHCMMGEMKDSVFLKTVTKNEQKLIVAGEYMTKFKANYEEIRYTNKISEITPELVDKILDIVNQIEKKRLFRGKGGEFMRIAVCRLIETISQSGLPLKLVHKKRFQDTLDECLKSFLENIQTAATKSLSIFSQIYHTNGLGKDNELFVKKMLKSAANDANVAITRGYTRGITSLSAPVLQQVCDEVIAILEKNCEIKKKDNDDSDTRRFAVNGIDKFIQTAGLGKDSFITQEIFDKLLDLLVYVLTDYTTDRRGDIGSVVREASMSAMSNVLKEYSNQKQKGENKIVISEKQIHTIVKELLQQLSEKIDRVRLVAGSVIQGIIDVYANQLPDFPFKEELKQVFNQERIQESVKQDQNKFDQNFDTEVINLEFEHFAQQNASGGKNEDKQYFIYYWNQPNAVFNIIVPLLAQKEYCYNILKGLVVSVGGLTESVIKYSKIALTDFIQKTNKSDKKDEIYSLIFENSIKIMQDHAKEERIIVPLFKTLDFIIENNEISSWEPSKTYAEQIYEGIQKETLKTKSIHKLNAAVGLIVGIVQLNNEKIQKSLYNLIHTYLIHKFPKIRKAMFDKLYIFLMTSGEDYFGEDQNEDILDFLSGVDWLDERFQDSEVTDEYFKLLKLEKINIE